ncbi:MAG: nuclear transport factor 2 family protein [Roseomonas sp.]|nr:nuclear transport factor 2 family protein [Roseomonas sp.]MCA3429450.1 nuclear transport factor 2 family protein [Roseomonas sp.]MCA3434196.1 nuclear transport factor 2 family protein [Roseomonas sp.]MCE2920331.1 nuclear transport factor 2 family protein [Roseomonas sp.]
MSMKRRHLALAGAAALAAANLNPPTAQAQGSDAAAVAAAVDALTKAMLAGDRAGLMAVTHERLSYGHSAGRIENRQQFIDPLVNKTSVFRSITVSDQTIDVVGDDAIVRHVLRGESESGGRVNPVNIGILQVWKKQPDGWKLLARQAFTRPS